MKYSFYKLMKNTALIALICLLGTVNLFSIQPEPPDKYFGYKPGADRMLFTYEELVSYLKKLAESSDRIKMIEIGKSPMGRPMYIAFVSSAENIANLDTLKAINKKLALDSNIPENERQNLFKQGKVFVLGTMSMHSEEVAPSTAIPLITFDLATTTDPVKLEWLNNTVYMIVPNHNPDGYDMVVENYRKYKGTRYEGSDLPGVYHKYVGHDNNRDFVTLTQDDNKAIAAIYNLDWFPQVMVEKHQMGFTGTRYFVPPVHDPIAENIDAGLWNWIGIFGSNLMKDMTKEGLAGVSQHFLFDNYWISSTETCLWKNVIAFLTEAASVKGATPIYIEPTELSVEGKGLSEYKKSINMPLPWPGGWWHLSDIVQYEAVSTMSILKTASANKEDILKFRNDICRKEVNNGKTIPPYYYILPIKQHDLSELVGLVNLMKEHGVYVFSLTKDVMIADTMYAKGDIVIPLSQPFRAFIKEVMEAQEYPVRHYTPGGEVIKPYDITSWSLPLHRGLKSVEIDRLDILPTSFDTMLEKIEKSYSITEEIPNSVFGAVFTANNNESYKAVFKALTDGLAVYRVQKPVSIDGEDFPAGSFIIYSNGKTAPMKSILSELTVTPHVIDKQANVEAVIVKMPRIALVETYEHDMDAGWTRYIMDTYGIPFKVLHPGDFDTTDFQANFDVVIFPDKRKQALAGGGSEVKDPDDYIPSYPPEFSKKIGKEGMNRLMVFMNKGGIIISWGGSTALFMGTQELSEPKQPKEVFQFPVANIAPFLRKDGLFCPGSLLRISLMENHPLTWGMQKEIGVFFRGNVVFNTTIPEFDTDRRVIGLFPEKNILLSGYCEKEETLKNQPVMVWLKKNKGQLVLFGFGPQFRASTRSGFKLLFNAILLPPSI